MAKVKINYEVEQEKQSILEGLREKFNIKKVSKVYDKGTHKTIYIDI